MTTVHDIPKLDGTGRRLGHTSVTVTQDRTGVVTLAGDDRRYEFPAGLWLQLTAPSQEAPAAAVMQDGPRVRHKRSGRLATVVSTWDEAPQTGAGPGMDILYDGEARMDSVLSRDFEPAVVAAGTGPRYTAHFTPEAYIRNDAVEVDPQGPQEWDCTTWAQLHQRYTDEAQERDGGDAEFIDTDDVFRDDPAAPAWVRGWRGPFTIRIRREGPGR
jgi:hypothetical protein